MELGAGGRAASPAAAATIAFAVACCCQCCHGRPLLVHVTSSPASHPTPGVGLPGLLAVKQGATRVLLTDYEPLVVEQLRANAELNDVAQRCSYLALDWFDLSTLRPDQRGAVSLLLLADVIYAAAVVQGLVDTMCAVLHPQGESCGGLHPLQQLLLRACFGEVWPPTAFATSSAAGVALVAHRIRRPLVFDRKDRIARLQERDEIFEAFKAACIAAGLHLRELSVGLPGAANGVEPLLLGVAADRAALNTLPLISAENN